jgi:hypothetical protein
MSPDVAGLLADVARLAREHGDEWFPGLGTRSVDTSLVSSDARARCFLHRVLLDDGRVRRTVMVKVRHSVAELRRGEKSEGRPQLMPERTLPDGVTARLEYDALRLIDDVLAGTDGRRFGVVRALAWVPGHDAIVMDLVDEPTLRRRALETSRLHRSRRSAGAWDDTAWSNAGAWLRLFHDHPADVPPERRNGQATDVARLYRELADFIGGHIGGDGVLADLRAGWGDEVAAHLPASLPTRLGHGDFVANNMFAGASGQVTVFDPLPRWQVPRTQDLATLVVGTRVIPLQATTQGAVLSRTDLDRFESALLRGYFGDEPVPSTEVRALQLLVLLDKWAALVGKRIPHGRVRPLLHEARVRVASRHLRRETDRMRDLLATTLG